MNRAGRNDLTLDWLWFLARGIASSIWCAAAASQLGAAFDEPFSVASGLKSWRTGRQSALRVLSLPVFIPLLSSVLSTELSRGRAAGSGSPLIGVDG